MQSARGTRQGVGWRRRRGWFLVLAAAVFVAGFLAGSYGRAAAPAPGSDADPLISRSYLEQFVGLVVVELAAGQRLVAEGGTELIVRGGQVTVIASPAGGLCNVTAGRDLAQGERVPANHLVIVPRTDGRGVLAVTPAFIMVRGPHTIR